MGVGLQVFRDDGVLSFDGDSSVQYMTTLGTFVIPAGPLPNDGRVFFSRVGTFYDQRMSGKQCFFVSPDANFLSKGFLGMVYFEHNGGDTVTWRTTSETQLTVLYGYYQWA